MMRQTLLAVCLSFTVALPASADELQRGVALGENLILRQSPRVDATGVRELHDGDALFVFERSEEQAWLGAEKDDWYRVETADGTSGWMHGSQLLRRELEAQATTSGVRMRTEPTPEGTYITHLGTGAWVTVIDRSDEEATIGGNTDRWYKVRTATAEGWVFGHFLNFALTTPSSAATPFPGWRCWPGKPGIAHPTPEQVLAGIVAWRVHVTADIRERLAQAGDDTDAAATTALAQAWDHLQAQQPLEALSSLAPIAAREQDAPTPLGSAKALASLFQLEATVEAHADADAVIAALDAAMRTGKDIVLTGQDWETPADLAAFDRGLFFFEQEQKTAKAARNWVARVAGDTSYSTIVRAAAGYHAVRLQFAARNEPDAIRAVRQVLGLGVDTQVTCGPLPVHYGVSALFLTCDELSAVGGGADAIALCESLLQISDPILQGAARTRLAQLHDFGTGDVDTVLAAYENVPAFSVRLADLTTVDGGNGATRAGELRARRDRIGGSDQAWVIGDRVRLRAAPSSKGAVLMAMPRDTIVRLLYPAPTQAESGGTPWMKVRIGGGTVGWMSMDYLEQVAPKIAGLPTAQGMLWTQQGAGPRGGWSASGLEIDTPVLVWRVPGVRGGAHALGDVTEDGTADVVVTGTQGDETCSRGVALIDGRTQREVWNSPTVGCVDGREAAVAGRVVVVPSDVSTVQAYDLRTGTSLWTWQGSNARITAPVVFGSTVAVASRDGLVHLLDLRSGEKRGRIRIGEPIRVAPAVQHGVMYVVTDTYLTAFDLSAKRPKWRTKLSQHPQRANAPLRQTGGVTASEEYILAASPSGTLLACRQQNGDPLWQVDVGGIPVGGPIFDGDLAIVALANGRLKAWKAETGTQAWSADLQSPVTSSMLLVDHTITVASGEGIVSGISRVDGRIRWQINLEAPLDRGPIGGGGRVLFGSSHAAFLAVIGDASIQQN